MGKHEIEEFAAALVANIRDAAVRSCDAILQPNANSPVAARWRKAAGVGGAVPPDVVIPDCVDEVVFHLLNAIDQGVIRLSFQSSTGTVVDLGEEWLGELAGWYMCSGGWRSRYSKERFVDDFADLAPN